MALPTLAATATSVQCTKLRREGGGTPEQGGQEIKFSIRGIPTEENNYDGAGSKE